VAGIPELVEPGRSGWLVPAGSVAELVESMQAALEAAPSKLTEMGRVGRARVLARHDIRDTARALASLLPREEA
jgi:glycosyltransferase involved in cell wall biosynthesis